MAHTLGALLLLLVLAGATLGTYYDHHPRTTPDEETPAWH